MFVDSAEIEVQAGQGGKGAVSFRREKYVPKGGPDGGDGGKGGDVIFVANRNLVTLMDFKYKTFYKAEDGTAGRGKKMFGKEGENCLILVPVGTIIIEKETGRILADLTDDGQTLVAAKGGRGGRGDAHFESSPNRGPPTA